MIQPNFEIFETNVFIDDNSIIINDIDYATIGGKIDYITYNEDNSCNIQISVPLYEELEFLTPYVYIRRFPITCKSNKDLPKFGTQYIQINNISLDKIIINK